MDWLDQNLDAYRLIAEMLSQLREVAHKTLTSAYGDEWAQKGLPKSVFDRLVASKEKERSIDWYESEYQELIDYAVFLDFLQIIENKPEAFPQFTGLAPNPSLLHARFLELDVMRAKIGRGRPISESELSFLSTFHLRLRAAAATPVELPPAAHEPTDETPEEQPAPPAEETHEQGPPASKESHQVQPPDEQDDQEITVEEPAKTDEPEEAPQEEVPPPPAAAPATAPSEEAQQRTNIANSIEQGETRQILTELYREITTTAEALWSDEPMIPPSVWEQVAVSTWYEQNFSRIGMKPVSDFYEVISKVHSRMADGISRDEIQTFLKESNFAQILLALRDMFQRNNV